MPNTVENVLNTGEDLLRCASVQTGLHSSCNRKELTESCEDDDEDLPRIDPAHERRLQLRRGDDCSVRDIGCAVARLATLTRIMFMLNLVIVGLLFLFSLGLKVMNDHLCSYSL